MSVESWSADLDRLQRSVKDSCVPCHFMHVDLAGSTLFKTRHPELEWVVRLRKFQEIVLTVVAPLNLASKLLGDGILLSGPQSRVSAKDLREAASAVLDGIAKANVDLLGERKIVSRILLSSGDAFLFPGDDPQGSSVDKLFRMEKLVPDDSIGMTDDFLGVEPGESPIAYFPLRGLPKAGNHGLFLADRALARDKRTKLLDESYSASLWLPSQNEPRKFVVVGGYIQGHPNLVQVGDMRAKIGVIMTLMKLGRAKTFDVCESSDFPDYAYNDDIITVGGPCFNAVTKQMLERLPVYFDCDDDDPDNDDTPLVERECGRRYEAVFEGERVTRDWGLFVRCRNPYNTERTLVVACGIESPAVDGIVRAFSPMNPNFLTLVDAIRKVGGVAPGQPLPDFYCIMPFEIENNGRAAFPTPAKQRELIRLIK